jgi:hypothetical protein
LNRHKAQPKANRHRQTQETHRQTCKHQVEAEQIRHMKIATISSFFISMHSSVPPYHTSQLLLPQRALSLCFRSAASRPPSPPNHPFWVSFVFFAPPTTPILCLTTTSPFPMHLQHRNDAAAGIKTETTLCLNAIILGWDGDGDGVECSNAACRQPASSNSSCTLWCEWSAGER